MRRLSSPVTAWQRRLMPLTLAAAVIGLGLGLYRVPSLVREPLLALSLVALVALVALFQWLLLRHLIDEVWDTGDGLLLRSRGEQVRLRWQDIESVASTRWINPPRIALTLRRETRFGRRIVFNPWWRPLEWSEHPLLAELRERMQAQTRGHDGQAQSE